MSVLNVKKNSALAAAVVIITACVALTTCNTPFGLGDSIDFEPPVLTIDPPPPNPLYVRQGTVLEGTVTDNVNVDRVIMRNAVSGEIMRSAKSGNEMRAALSGGATSKQWKLELDFTEEQNGEKIAVEIIAYDRGGNTGDRSFVALTLIIDIRPPVVEDIWIQRTNIRRADLESYQSLKELETTDSRGERSVNMDRYQNGAFHVSAVAAESETRIDIISLNIYDAIRDPNTPLLVLEREQDSNSTDFKPRWLVEEDKLIAAGQARWSDYANRYYNNGERYYYRVAVIALDRSKNESQSLIREDQGLFAMWERADIPKGIIDPLVGGVSGTIVITKGATLPVEFFDDDQLLFAYTGLLTREQWDGSRPLNGAGLVMMGGNLSGTTNAERLQWLKQQLTGDVEINDWRMDRYHNDINSDNSNVPKPPIDNLAKSPINQTTPFVQTGNNDKDNGSYVLFAITADTKLAPHDTTKAAATFRTRERLELYDVEIIDENEPLIVFDTVNTGLGGYDPGVHPGSDIKENFKAAQTGNSPEENTFPRLTDGRYFEINGYTLRANKASVDVDVRNTVQKFRLAWIPFRLANGASGETLISEVQRALQAGDYPSGMNSLGTLHGVQHWDFGDVFTFDEDDTIADKEGILADSAYDEFLIMGTDQVLDENNAEDIFTKQVFRKRFDVMGGPDNRKPAYRNFRARSDSPQVENETKLFVFYAEDNMGHVVFRQLRLLGNKTPPEMTIYDITNKDAVFGMDYTNTTVPQLPNLNEPNSGYETAGYYFFRDGTIQTEGRNAYRKKLLAYQATGYSILRGIAMPGGEIDSSLVPAEVNAAYPRDTVVKYWVTARSSGDLAVQNIQVRDVTFESGAQFNAGSYAGRTYDENSGWERDPNVFDRQVFLYKDPVYDTSVTPNSDFANDVSLSFVEILPEVTQRVFMFTAVDSLGNTANIQRTLAVTNAAVLSSITTDTQNGSYGIGTTITLRANFSSLVRWEGTNPPLLNVGYFTGAPAGSNPNASPTAGTRTIRQIATKTAAGVSTLSLEFDLVVAQGDLGRIETMFIDIDDWSTLLEFDVSNNRPITLPENTRILDASRGDNAFTPGNVAGFNWTKAGRGPASSLQGSKRITLQGIRPQIDTFHLTSVPDKVLYTDTSYPGYYYKADETIEFALTADKPISPNADVPPVVEFEIGSNAWYEAAWTRTDSENAMDPLKTGNRMIFRYSVTGTTLHGRITNIRIKNASSIRDNVGNAFVGGTNPISVTSVTPPVFIERKANGSLVQDVVVRVDKTPPTAPNLALSPAGTAVNGVAFYRTNPTMTISGTGGEGEGLERIEYSFDGGVTWFGYEASPTGGHHSNATWNASPGNLNVGSGNWTLQARLTDRAGNRGAAAEQQVNINAEFPSLVAVSPMNPNGFYRTNSTLSFNLNFSAPVYTQSAAAVTITLSNRRDDPAPATGVQTLSATAIAVGNAATTVSFVWTALNFTGKEMLDGLYISAVNFDGLRDRFGNSGGSGTASISGTTPAPIIVTKPNAPNGFFPGTDPVTYTNPNVANLNGAGIIVDCIAPAPSTFTPANDPPNIGTLPGGTTNNRNREVKIEFNENMAKGSGIITVRPSANFAVPPVFENSGYYLGTDGKRYSNPSAAPSGVYTTWIDGFSDIYNKAATGERARLTQGSNMSSGLTLNARTGNSAGPYVRTTHGLIEGAGYTGNWTDSANGPAPTAGRMIPDTSTKWVLSYQNLIDNTTAGSAVSNIRATLTNIKFRWQEIDVTSSNVQINGKTVTITFPEPLLDGLKWDLDYPAGTFTDLAGNNAPAIASAAYSFMSSGVQAPVIRVNRRSFDARTANWQSTSRTYAVPDNTANWNTDTIDITANNGWGITDFNVVHYRIETETPGASLTSGELRGTLSSGSAVNGAWTGAVGDANSGVTVLNAANWDTTTGTNGTWVLNNLVRRAGTNASRVSYTITENGIAGSRDQASGADYQGLRSYNADPLKTALDAVSLTAFGAANKQGRITFSTSTTDPSYEASKNYIVAQASVTTDAAYTAKSYEGIFRSVVMLNQASYGGWFGTPPGSDGANGTRMVLVEGSNIKNGMPSIAGFPVRDAEETGDNRFIKVFHYTWVSNSSGRFFWVSTEIVSQWYELNFGGTHQQTGEVNNYLTAGYGDLTYSYNQR